MFVNSPYIWQCCGLMKFSMCNLSKNFYYISVFVNQTISFSFTIVNTFSSILFPFSLMPDKIKSTMSFHIVLSTLLYFHLKNKIQICIHILRPLLWLENPRQKISLFLIAYSMQELMYLTFLLILPD